MSDSVLTKKQQKIYGPKIMDNGSRETITATVRYDDRCNNGHNTFSITGSSTDGSGGCIHDKIVKCFPELAPYIKYHLFSSDGPLNYISNTLYLAGDRDHWGLRKDEKRQTNWGGTNKLVWDLAPVDIHGNVITEKIPTTIYSETQPRDVYKYAYVPHYLVGDGKERQLDAARESACWPEATDEELMAPDLEERLKARLPKLIEEFRQAVESLGFVF